MKITNLVSSLLEREIHGNKTSYRKFEGVFEYKTAISSTININYDLKEMTKSTFVVTFSPDKTKIATSHGNHSIKISDCFTFKVLLTLKGHPRTPWCVSFHPRINSLLASGCLGGQVRLWDLNKMSDENIVYQSQSVISSLSFHPVDDILVVSSHNKIIFYDWNTQQTVRTIQTKHFSETVRLVRFLPDGSKLITGITNASSQYCKPERLNVSSRGNPHGHSVVQTVHCMEMQQYFQRERLIQHIEGTQTHNSFEQRKKHTCGERNKNMNLKCSEVIKHDDSKKRDSFKRKMIGKNGCHNASHFKQTDENDPGQSGVKIKKRIKVDNITLSSGKDISFCKTNPLDKRNITSRERPSMKIGDENVSARKDHIPLSRKSCLNFFRPPMSSYINIPENMLTSAGQDFKSTSICGTDQRKTEQPTVSKPSDDQITATCSTLFHSSTDDIDTAWDTSREPATSSATKGFGGKERLVPSEAETLLDTPGDIENPATSESVRATSSVRIFLENGSQNPNDIGTVLESNLSLNDSQVCSQELKEPVKRIPCAARLHQTNMRQQGRSQIWNFSLGPTMSSYDMSAIESLNDLEISVEGAASTIPVHGYITYPCSDMDQSSDVTNLLGVRTAVATATARSSHHVHTAVVIASQETENSETALETAVNRAIAGAFAGSGEGAVANNIIDTTHKLQLWDSNVMECPDIQNEHKNVIVPMCKIHNDSSFDVSQDGLCMAVSVPSEFGFPNDAQIKVISLKAETFLQCIYSRKYGPNAVSVSLSSLNNYLMIGLASHKLDWQVSSQQLIGQIVQLPPQSHVNYEDKSKPVLNIQHKCNEIERNNISVNTIRFHPTPGMGIIYGTNRGHVQHCHIEPDHNLIENRINVHSV